MGMHTNESNPIQLYWEANNTVFKNGYLYCTCDATHLFSAHPPWKKMGWRGISSMSWPLRGELFVTKKSLP